MDKCQLGLLLFRRTKVCAQTSIGASRAGGWNNEQYLLLSSGWQDNSSRQEYEQRTLHYTFGSGAE